MTIGPSHVLCADLCGTLSTNRQVHTQKRKRLSKQSFLGAFHEKVLVESLVQLPRQQVVTIFDVALTMLLCLGTYILHPRHAFRQVQCKCIGLCLIVLAVQYSETRTHSCVRNCPMKTPTPFPTLLCGIREEYVKIFIQFVKVDGLATEAWGLPKGILYFSSQHLMSVVFLVLIKGLLPPVLAVFCLCYGVINSSISIIHCVSKVGAYHVRLFQIQVEDEALVIT